MAVEEKTNRERLGNDTEELRSLSSCDTNSKQNSITDDSRPPEPRSPERPQVHARRERRLNRDVPDDVEAERVVVDQPAGVARRHPDHHHEEHPGSGEHHTLNYTQHTPPDHNSTRNNTGQPQPPTATHGAT